MEVTNKMFNIFSKNKKIAKIPDVLSIQREKEDLSDLKRYIEEFLLFLPLPVCWVNPLGVVIDANSAFYKLIGYKQEINFSGEETILRIENLFQDKAKWKQVEERILRKKLVDGEEMVLLRRGGKDINVSVWGSWRESSGGRISGYFLALSDITEVKSLQESLEQKVAERTEDLGKEKERNLAVLHSLNEGLLVFDEHSQISLMNSQAEKFLDVEGSKIRGKKIFDLNFYRNFRPLVSLLGNQIQEVFRQEIQIKENLILQISTIPLMFKAGNKAGTIVVLHDVTREKMVERMKSEFVTVAAHQLRTPTSAIKWSLKMLLDGDLGSLEAHQKEVVEKTYLTNEKVIQLIRDLLNVARIEEGRFLTAVVLARIEEVILAVIKDYAYEIKKRKLIFEFRQIDKELPQVMLDVEKMKIAISNIIDNAVRYTFPGGRISLFVRKKDEEIEVQIEDTGAGIPRNQQEKVFTKFFRADNIVKMETEGTGLGLFISKSIIEAHGGKIWFTSEQGRGTTFFFTIPMKERFAEYLTEEFY